jgi:hypothetical protein
MSIYKFSYAFQYGSYAEAIRNSSFTASDISRILQGYFSGPQNVGVAIEFQSQSCLKLTNTIFDILRSIVPISFLMKGHGMVTSELFNNFIYNGLYSSGHVLSSAGYGYIYGGYILSSFFMLINIFIAMFCEKRMKVAIKTEWIYVWSYIMLRFALNLNVNLPSLVSASTIMLFTGGLLYGSSCLLGVRRKTFIK